MKGLFYQNDREGLFIMRWNEIILEFFSRFMRGKGGYAKVVSNKK